MQQLNVLRLPTAPTLTATDSVELQLAFTKLLLLELVLVLIELGCLIFVVIYNCSKRYVQDATGSNICGNTSTSNGRDHSAVPNLQTVRSAAGTCAECLYFN
jgi:hypothetical protein